jgi:hypothetical protein
MGSKTLKEEQYEKGENLRIIILLDFVVPLMPPNIAYGVCKPFYQYCASSPVLASFLKVLPTICSPRKVPLLLCIVCNQLSSL